MRKQNTEALITLAKSQQDRFAVSRAIAESVEVGIVVPSVLRSKLEALGCIVEKNPGRQFENVVQIAVKHGDEIIAMGTSVDEADALLHAMLGFVRERNIAALEEQGMSKAEAVARSVGGSAVVK